MAVCPRNSCAGGYGNCLDVKITNQCNAACAFCIERGGYSPAPDKTPTELAIATVAQKDFPTVLILGGEPTKPSEAPVSTSCVPPAAGPNTGSKSGNSCDNSSSI